MPEFPKLTKSGNVAYEGFTGPGLDFAKLAMQRAVAGANLASNGIYKFDSRISADRIREWFGLSPASNPSHAQLLMGVTEKIRQFNKAITGNPITLVNRPDIMMNHVPIGQQVYGYVWTHRAGSGYRIVLGKWFTADPDQYEAAQTIYHELTHKVAHTVDHAYGVEKCRKLASAEPRKAVENADNFGYFMKSYLCTIR
jgi:peptidyl-Lys metalloendopeptidase